MIAKAFTAALLTAAALSAEAADAPRVAASIAPIHSLTAAVMRDVGAPTLIVDPRQSEHTFQLRPSDVRALSEARLVVWIGPEAEPMFARTIAALPRSVRVLTLTRFRALTLLPRRTGPGWGNGHDHGQKEEKRHAPIDPHIWLDADNARFIVEVIREALVELDPAHAYLYTRNAARTGWDIRYLDREIRHALEPVSDRRYLVYHDAYQYFERRYGLSPAGAIALSPEVPPGARRIAELRALIRAGGIACVFHEPQFPAALVSTITEGLDVRTGTLDPVGVGHPPGPALWFEVMRGLARSFAGCLS